MLTILVLVGLRTVGLERARIIVGRPITPLLVNLCLALVSFFVAGEAFLRVAFSDGMSFGTQEGPMVRRFQREFVFNRFDGPSRGPEVSGPKAAGAIRVLVQGDSIT